MFRINGNNYQGICYYRRDRSGEIAAEFQQEVTEEELQSIKDATLLERIDVRDMSVEASFRLIGWRSIENRPEGLRVCWQTYVIDDVEDLRQDNEDLTSAILELAAIIGGDGNG